MTRMPPRLALEGCARAWGDRVALRDVTLEIPAGQRVVLRHELFHAKTEAALTWLELGALKKKYLKYKNDVSENARGKEFWREEALANWEAMQWGKKGCDDKVAWARSSCPSP